MMFIEQDNHEIKNWVLHTPHREFSNHIFYQKLGYIKVSESKISDKLTMFEFRKEIKD